MLSSPQNQSALAFGDFRIDTVQRVLTHQGELVPLTPKVFDLLLMLVEKHGQLVEKHQLLDEIWPGTFVEEGNLTQNISVLRKALGGKQYIQTIPRRGYRFVGDVRHVPRIDEELIVEEHTSSRVVITQNDLTNSSIQSISLPAPGPSIWRRRNLLVVGAGLFLIVAAGIVWTSAGRVETVIARPQIKTIAVLPFKPLSNEGREEYLELGIADALITRLSNIKQIQVRPTSSVRKYAGANYDPIIAGRELRTDAVIDGSIQRLGDRLRINVQLVRISDGTVLWGYHCDDMCTDLFTAQDSISENVARSLTLTLSDVEGQALAKRYTANGAALRAYLNARYYYGKRTKESAIKTVEYLEKAVALDPQFALAYAALAEAYASLAFLLVKTTDESMLKARTAAQEALRLDPTLAEAHSAVAFVKLTYDWDWTGAEQEFRKALDLNPNQSVVHDEYATLLEAVGRTDEAIVETNKAHELDPLSLIVMRNNGRAYYYARQYDRAIQIWLEVSEMDPLFPAVQNWLTLAYEADGKYKEAIDSRLKQDALAGMDAESLQSLRQTYGSTGWTDFWKRDFELHKSQLKDPMSDRYEIVQLYRRLDQTDEAFRWLNKACDERSIRMIWLKVDPALDNLRFDPRFLRLMNRVGLPN